MATRNGSAEWRGDLQGGSGRVTVGNSAHTGAYSAKSRFEEGEDGTNPEELLAAGLAACFSMALSNTLAEAGHTPESVNTTARAQLRPVDGAPTITQMQLRTEAVAPGLDDAEFQRLADDAKRNCPVSRALAGPEITLEATLNG